MNAGAMNDRIQVLSKSNAAANDFGEQVESYNTLLSLWAQRKRSGESEGITEGRNTQRTTEEFIVRSTVLSRTIDASMKLIWNGINFRITAIDNSGRFKGFLRIKAEGYSD